jgi:DNA-binding NtrC family response regulator
LVVLNEDGVVRAGDLPDYVVNNTHGEPQRGNEVLLPHDGIDLDGILERIENGFIQQALQRTRGNKTTAAELLNLNRTTFIERLRKKGMLQTARRIPAGANDAMRPTSPEANFTSWNAMASLFADGQSLADVTV